MTTGLLRSVAKSPSVKRVVVTSSIVCLDFDREGLLKGKVVMSPMAFLQLTLLSRK